MLWNCSGGLHIMLPNQSMLNLSQDPHGSRMGHGAVGSNRNMFQSVFSVLTCSVRS